MAVRVLFDPINREVEAQRGDILLDVMRESGIRIESLCGGKGQCGKCKVILERGEVERVSKAHEKLLSHDELEVGYHLACMVRLIGDCVFTIPAESRVESPKILLSTELAIDRPDPSTKKYLLESSPFV
ncbi:MAG: 2Fe-2S iron-sulfur cluster-binding protein, partial [Candidatus Bathyarchaeia archaeon]